MNAKEKLLQAIEESANSIVDLGIEEYPSWEEYIPSDRWISRLDASIVGNRARSPVFISAVRSMLYKIVLPQSKDASSPSISIADAIRNEEMAKKEEDRKQSAYDRALLHAEKSRLKRDMDHIKEMERRLREYKKTWKILRCGGILPRSQYRGAIRSCDEYLAMRKATPTTIVHEKSDIPF